MKIVTRKENPEVDFEDLDEGETFSEPSTDQVQIKTDGGDGCCLASGELTGYDEGEKVVRVNCEVRIL